MLIVPHYSAISDTVSCDAPIWRDRLERQALSAIPSLDDLSLDCDRAYLSKEVGVQQRLSAIPQKTQCDAGRATGVLRLGGYFGRVTKPVRPRFGSVTVSGWKGLSGSRFSVLAVPLEQWGFLCFCTVSTERDGSGSGFALIFSSLVF